MIGMAALTATCKDHNRDVSECWAFSCPTCAFLCAGIYPLQNVAIRKVKVLKAPKFDLTKLMEVHGDYTEEVGAKVERPAPIVGADEPAAE